MPFRFNAGELYYTTTTTNRHHHWLTLPPCMHSMHSLDTGIATGAPLALPPPTLRMRRSSGDGNPAAPHPTCRPPDTPAPLGFLARPAGRGAIVIYIYIYIYICNQYQSICMRICARARAPASASRGMRRIRMRMDVQGGPGRGRLSQPRAALPNRR